MPTSGPARLLAESTPAAYVFALAALLGLEVYDLDVWWHLAIGRDILLSHSVPTVDRWTILGQGRPYHDSHWLFQAAMAAAHGILGMPGVQVLTWATWGACFTAIWRLARRTLDVETSALLVLLAATCCFERLIPRPEMVSCAAFAWTLLWLAEGRGARRADLVRFALLQATWTNSHGLFVLGPFAAACHLAASSLARRRHPEASPSSAARVLGAVLVGSVASRFGIRGWQYSALLFRESTREASWVVGTLGEMSSPFGAAARQSPAVWAFYALLGTGAVALASTLLRRELPAHALVAATCAALAVTGRRNVALFAVGAIPLLAAEASRWRRPRWLGASGVQAAVVVLSLAVAWAPLSGWLQLRLEIPARWGMGATPSFFPHALPSVLSRVGVSGGVLASNTLGGFVAFHGSPGTLPLSDGRWEIYDPEALRDILRATRSAGDWRRVIRRYGLGAILLAHTSPEASAMLPDLASAADWTLVFYDRAASLWVPVAAARAVPPVDLRDPLTLPSTPRTEDAMLLAVFLSRVGARSLEIEVLRRGLALGRRQAWFLERLGNAELAEGRRREAEAAFRSLLAIEPRSEAALNELAFLAFRRGDIDAAAALLTDLVRIAPENSGYRENLERVEAARAGRSGAPARQRQ